MCPIILPYKSCLFISILLSLLFSSPIDLTKTIPFVGVYIVMVCPWRDHILARNPFLEVEADLSRDLERGDFPTDFHS